MQIGQSLKSELPCGIRVDVSIEQTRADKPLIYKYTYSLNGMKLQEWLSSKHIKPLCEGPLAFSARGVQVVVPWGIEKWDKTAFSIDDEDGNQLFLELFKDDVVFHVNRDLFAGKEWVIVLEAAPKAEVKEQQVGGFEPEEEDDPPF